MKKRNAANDAARAARRRARLGEDAVCVLCGYSNADALRPIKRSILEKHHVVGRNHEPDVEVPLCPTCHTELTVALQDAGASMDPVPNLLDRQVSMLRALSTFHVPMGEALDRRADDLTRFILWLDQHYPEWRKDLEVKK